MLAEIGFVALILAFLAAVYALVASAWGERTGNESLVLSGRNAALLNFLMVTVSTLALQIALMTEDYQIAYVWSVSSPSMPEIFRATALWGSQAGSLLFWSWVMTGFTAAALVLNWHTHRRLMPYAISFMMAVVIFFLGISLLFENPFERWWTVSGEQAAHRGQDVVLMNAGGDPSAVTNTLIQLTGINGDQAASLMQQMPISVRNCVSGDSAMNAQLALEAAGGVVTVQPAHTCTIRATLAPANATAPPAASLAQSAQGLNPLLRHFGMVIHPPMLYLGFVGFVIPFAFAMAALASGDLSTNWIKASRRWSLVAWLFLSLGLILGGRWAYDVLGWGGYWGWDPVENAAFLPWLIGTAYLHSVMIQEKRGMFKLWNMFLVIGTFSAVIFGTFATRSGLVDSVHSFARSEIGMPMFVFWSGMTIVSVGLIMWRYNQGHLRDERPLVNILSRETLFVLNNFVFVALALVIFWGSFGGPIASELFFNTDITHGADYFMRTTPILFAALYLLMGLAPVSAWGATSFKRLGSALAVPFALTLVSLLVFVLMGMGSALALFAYAVVLLAGWVAVFETYRGVMARVRTHGESYLGALAHIFQRNPRRYGGYMIHFGVVIIGIGVIGSTLFQAETQQTLGVGESLTIQDYTLRYDGLLPMQIAQDGRVMDIAEVTVLRDGREIAQLRPRRDWFPENTGMNSMTIAGAHSTVENDFYVLLVGWEQIGVQAATFKVYINPLVNLVWWGGLILILGTIFAVWPKEVLPARVRKQAHQLSQTKHQGARA